MTPRSFIAAGEAGALGSLAGGYLSPGIPGLTGGPQADSHLAALSSRPTPSEADMEPVYRTVVGICLATFKLLRWDVQVTGIEHVPRTGGAVIATNHIGFLDFIFVGYGVLQAPGKRLVRFAAKKEVFDHRLSGPLMRAMRHISVDRGGEAAAAIERSVHLLQDGELVGMFPEATISTSFVPLRGKSGTARMAIRAGVPIVPGAIWGSQRLLTRGRSPDIRRNVVITVDFGGPILPGPSAEPAVVTRELMARIGELTARAQERYPQRPGADEQPWWLPAHLGGTAPTPEQAEQLAREESARRRAQRRKDLAG